MLATKNTNSREKRLKTSLFESGSICTYLVNWQIVGIPLSYSFLTQIDDGDFDVWTLECHHGTRRPTDIPSADATNFRYDHFCVCDKLLQLVLFQRNYFVRRAISFCIQLNRFFWLNSPSRWNHCVRRPSGYNARKGEGERERIMNSIISTV